MQFETGTSAARRVARLGKTAYLAQHTGMLLHCLAAQRLLRALSGNRFEPPEDARRFARKRYVELLERDLANVERGMYPQSLLFQFPYGSYLRKAPHLAADLPRAIRRASARDFKDLPPGVDVDRYPAYFRRNFHWQTDGYFSRRSAALYDLGVELLFLGMADVMRRQVIPPVTEEVRRGGARLRLLDVGCGTGRTLKQLAVTHPTLDYVGLDLSPYYLAEARTVLSDVERLSLVHENAEALPFKDGYFDVVVSVYLFHELPRAARRNVYREMLRVLRPGGRVVIQDSGQESDGGPLATFLARFSEDFHEPYHREYLCDDIAAALSEVGFEVDSSEPCFVAKVVSARKPG